MNWKSKVAIALPVLLSILIIILIFWINAADNNKWTFAVICDTRGNDSNYAGKTGINDAVLKEMAFAIAKEKCKLVLVPGDMVNGYWANNSVSYADQFKKWNDTLRPLYDAKIKVYTTRGNHEYGNYANYGVYPYNLTLDEALQRAYLNEFADDNPDSGPLGEKDLTYNFSYNNALFIGLDVYANNHSHRVNQEWLDDVLETNNKTHIFVFGHEPAFKVNHNDSLAVYPAERDAFWDSLGQAGCRVYFCGHDHFYNRALIKDSAGNEIRQMLVGSCGAPFKPWIPYEFNGSSRFVCEHHNARDYGYALVTVDRENATVEWKSWDGSGEPKWTAEDRFTINALDI